MKTILIQVICPHCQHEAYIKSEQFIIPEFNRKLYEQIIQETFFVYHCPVCHTKIEYIHDCLYHDHKHQLLVVLRHDESKEIFVEAGHEVIRRLVKTPKELRETIMIFENHLHDVPICYMKAKLMKYFDEQMRGIKDIYFRDVDEDKQYLWFEVFDENNRLDIKAVPFAYYEDAFRISEGMIDDSFLQVVNMKRVMDFVKDMK